MNKKSFTLIEIIISMMIFSIILSSLIGFLLKTKKIHITNSAAINNFLESSLTADFLSREIKSCNLVSSSSTQNKLILIKGADIITYENIGNKIKRNKNTFGQYLTNDGVIDKVSFSYPKDNVVRIEILPVLSPAIITMECFLRNYNE